MVEVREYLDHAGRSPFAAWFDRLNREAAAKVTAALDFGPGYRIYFGKDAEHLVILVAGGSKKRQQQDIATALARWKDYKQQKSTGE